MYNLLHAHGLIGCDIIVKYYKIGKTRALKILCGQLHNLDNVDDISKSLDDDLVQATPFMLACYSQPSCTSLTKAHQKLWSSKVTNCIRSTTELASLPPTSEALALNVARAHLQVAIWKHKADSSPTKVRPQYAWLGQRKYITCPSFTSSRYSQSTRKKIKIHEDQGIVVVRGYG